MRFRTWFLLVIAVLWGTLGCTTDAGFDDEGDTGSVHDVSSTDVAGGADATTDGGVSDPDAVDAHSTVPDTSDEPDTPSGEDAVDVLQDVDPDTLPECDKPVNAEHKRALLAAQPEIEVRSRAVLTEAISFASLGEDPDEICAVELDFRDSNGNGTLEPFENWTLSPAERATDLVARLSDAEKLGLMAHGTTDTAPTSSANDVSEELAALIEEGVRFARATTTKGQLGARATWANNVQELCEASAHGIPFVISMAPVHAQGGGRDKASGFSRWPLELGFGATGDAGVVETFGDVVAQEYRALGIHMALSPNADLATEPRWHRSQFTYGEDSEKVAEFVAAYVRGLQGEAAGAERVAATVRSFPGAGAARDGWDPQLDKGQFLSYPGDNLDAHLAPFSAALDAGAAAVMLSYGAPQAGAWTGLDGLLDGATIEEVAASFNSAIVSDTLREHYGFDGLVVAPAGVLDVDGPAWGVEALSPAERVAAAVSVGVDQFAGVTDLAPLDDALAAGDLTSAQLSVAATRALTVIFGLGLFEDPYVDARMAPAFVNTDPSYRAGLNAMNRSMVLLANAEKPRNWLNGDGDGSQTGDKANAGNGSGLILPAPPGEAYVAAGCSYFIMGDFDLDYVRSVSTGYGELTNDSSSIDGVDVATAEERIPLTDYVFIRIPAPYTADPDSGELAYAAASLEYASNDNADALEDIAFARAAIDAADNSKTQIVVAVDAGRASVVDEILAYGVDGLYVDWGVTDKVFLDVAFGIVNGVGVLPVGVPASDEAAAEQLGDVAGDGQHGTFVEGFGFETSAF